MGNLINQKLSGIASIFRWFFLTLFVERLGLISTPTQILGPRLSKATQPDHKVKVKMGNFLPLFFLWAEAVQLTQTQLTWKRYTIPFICLMRQPTKTQYLKMKFFYTQFLPNLEIGGKTVLRSASRRPLFSSGRSNSETGLRQSGILTKKNNIY